MSFINPAEKYQSQIPALQLLINLGFEPLSQAQVEKLRGQKLRQVLLEEILEERILKLNNFHVKGQVYPCDIEDAIEAIRQLKPSPEKLKGLKRTNQDMYDALMLGGTVRKTIDGDSKSYTIRYIDWINPDNNRYHVAAEFSVERIGSQKTCRCDIVCFVNGIPFVVIENKSQDVSLAKAENQLINYQKEDHIPYLFHYTQLLLTMNRAEAKYATVGSSVKFWHCWYDDVDEELDIHDLINKPLTEDQKKLLFSGDFKEALTYFNDMEACGDRLVTKQDRLIYALCRKDRLLDLVRRFTVFDKGERKIARHQQYFSVLAALKRIKHLDVKGQRQGGVIWHTQGSGKSLTMVMLARSLAMESGVQNPRILIVTDREDLDIQIKDTFKSCDMEPRRASSGKNLLALIEQQAPLITTIINKFDAACRLHEKPQSDGNVFVLVDESHRSQYGKKQGFGYFAKRMRRLLPNACYIGFTGTPLLKREKNTLQMFGGLIHDYSIARAVEEGVIVPLFYEGRIVEQKIAASAIDQWFDKMSVGLTDQQKIDLKKKFARRSKLSTTSQTLAAKAFDISEHYRGYWQDLGFKAQLVAPSKAAAVAIHEILEEIGHVSSAVIISAPDDHEGVEDVDDESKSSVKRFWDKMMACYGSEKEYNQQIVSRFKSADDPEILIVVSKLLTGFDAPRNAILYLCRSLKEHNLLQAIARVNRLFEENGREKEFGLIVDYEGLLGELDEALTTYGSFKDYDQDDLLGVLTHINEYIRQLPHLYDQLWDVFKEVSNKKDIESLEQYLADEILRATFYEQLRVFGRALQAAVSSEKVYDVFNEKVLDQFRRDLRFFSDLKKRVQVRYQEINDKSVEPRIQKLLDQHISAEPAKLIIEMININDDESLRRVVDEQNISSASKADRIASATKRTITLEMNQDPAFYKRFSELLEQVIADYRVHRLSEKGYLKEALNIARKVSSKERDEKLPLSIKGDDVASAFYEVIYPILKIDNQQISADEIAEITLSIIAIIRRHLIVNVWNNPLIKNQIHNEIEDYFFEVVRDQKGFILKIELLDCLEREIMQLAQARF